jgi:hypothetical protein
VFLHWRRLRLGGEKWAANHTIHPRTIATVLNDPEYQAQGPAKGLNLCYINPKPVMTVAQMARDYFDGKGELPEGFKALGDYYALVPEDVATYCNCERCRALLDRGQDMKTGFFSSGELSDYWFSFVNAVTRELRQTHPDKHLATLAYWNYAYPPRDFDLEPNVSIAPCLHTCAYAINDEVRENDMRFYHAWLTKRKPPCSCGTTTTNRWNRRSSTSGSASRTSWFTKQPGRCACSSTMASAASSSAVNRINWNTML